MVKTFLKLVLGVVFLNVSCTTHKNNVIYNYSLVKDAIDYSDIKNWAAHPLSKDNADSISEVFKGDVNLDLVDVFFLHPTSFTENKFKQVSNASLEDTMLNEKTDNSSILYQSTIFNEVGRIYAPRYRQAHIQRYYDTGKIRNDAFELAYADVKEAFLTYLEKWNDGRSIVIASHSQGTTHAQLLLEDLVDDKEISNRIIFLYLLGMPVGKKSFKTINPCRDDSSNFCFVSWRTFRKGYVGKYSSVNDTSIQVNNPVDIYAIDNWATVSKKKKAILWDFKKGYEKTHDSKVMGNMLWITKPKFKGGFLGLFIKNYHAGDFNLYYEDIRSDIKRRLIQELSCK